MGREMPFITECREMKKGIEKRVKQFKIWQLFSHR